MGFIDSFLLLGLFFVGLPVAAAVGWVLEKLFRVSWLGRLPIVLVLLTTLFGVPLALRVAGVPATARVVARDERVKLAWRDGAWTTSQWLRVRFLPAHAGRADPVMRDRTDSVTLALRSTATMYDRTPVGATVPVTYVSFRPSIAKLSERTLGDLVREMLAVAGLPALLTLVAALVLAALLSSWSPAWPAARRLRTGGFVALGAAAAVAALELAFTSPAHGADGPMPALAEARVEAISSIGTGRCFLCEEGTSAPLNQPYQVVTLAFTPSGARWPVRTADAVDSGSVRGLRDGAVVAVRYAPATPRAARIEGARRTFETRNGRDAFWEAVLVAGALLAVYLVFQRVTRNVWRRARPT